MFPVLWAGRAGLSWGCLQEWLAPGPGPPLPGLFHPGCKWGVQRLQLLSYQCLFHPIILSGFAAYTLGFCVSVHVVVTVTCGPLFCQCVLTFFVSRHRVGLSLDRGPPEATVPGQHLPPFLYFQPVTVLGPGVSLPQTAYGRGDFQCSSPSVFQLGEFKTRPCSVVTDRPPAVCASEPSPHCLPGGGGSGFLLPFPDVLKAVF